MEKCSNIYNDVGEISDDEDIQWMKTAGSFLSDYSKLMGVKRYEIHMKTYTNIHHLFHFQKKMFSASILFFCADYHNIIIERRTPFG